MDGVGYRDDQEGLRERMAELEDELSDAKRTIARLRGEQVGEARGGFDWFLGHARRLELERELPFEISDEGIEAISELVNARVPGGSFASVGRSFTHRRASYEFRVVRIPVGHTVLRLTTDYAQARTVLAIAGPAYSMIAMAVFGGLAAAFRAPPVMILMAVVLGMVGAFMALRAFFKWRNSVDQRRVVAMFEAAADLAKKHRRRKKRIAAEADEVDTQAEEEAMLEEEERERRHFS